MEAATGPMMAMPATVMGSGRISAFKVHTALDGGIAGPGDGGVDHAFRGNQTGGRSQITSAYGMGTDHLGQHAGAECVSRQYQQAGGITVQAVNGPVGSDLSLLPQIPGDSVSQCIIVISLGRMNGDAGGLIDDEKVTVLVPDVQVHGNGNNIF